MFSLDTMFSLDSMPTTASILSAYATITTFTMLIRKVLNEIWTSVEWLIPQQVREKILAKLKCLSRDLSSQMTITIDEYVGDSMNEIYRDSEICLRMRIPPSVKRLRAFKSPREKKLSLTFHNGEKISDEFEGIQLKWQLGTPDDRNGDEYENQSFLLSFDSKHTEKVTSGYLEFIQKTVQATKKEDKPVKLTSLGRGRSINLEHPTTFDTLAMDPKFKKEVIDDLNRFLERRELYRRVGKAWKRGYLLYGPPGTGKSSLIAAMANHLKFDIYDLELTNSSDIMALLHRTTNRSILVIEDIDCSVELQDRKYGKHNQSDSPLTLSGMLNFIDGLWSSCGDARIIVLTTNHKDRLDPAMLRPGRMDMHICMSYCTPCGFETLASNYLGINCHPRFTEIGELITQLEVTPAEIAEEFMRSENADIAHGGLIDADKALQGLIKFLQRKKMQQQQDSESNAQEEQGVSEQGK